MLPIRKLISATLPAILSLCACVSSGLAQETNADAAKKLLQQGLAKFQAKDYMGARKDLGSLSSDSNLASTLDKADKDQLDKVLPGMDAAVNGQAEGKDNLALGSKALEANKLPDAQKAFTKAAENGPYLIDADNKAVQDGLSRVKQALAAAPKAPADVPAAAPAGGAEAPSGAATASAPQTPAPEAPAPVVAEGQTDDILGVYARQRAVRKQKAEFDMNEAVKRANEVLAKANSATEYDAASAAVSVAANVLTNEKTLFMPDEIRHREEQFDQLRTFIQTKRAVWEHKVVVEQRKQVEELEGKRLKQSQDEIRRQVFQLSADAQDAIHRKQYVKAMDMMDKILRIDPDNQGVRDEKFILQQVELLQREKGFSQEENYQRQQSMIDIREAEIPWYELLRYPKDWREITARREPYSAAGGSGTEENRLILGKLKRKIPTVSFENTEFKSVIDWLKQVNNVDIQVNYNVLETASITQATLVKNVHLTDKTLETVIDYVLKDIGGATPLRYIVYKGAILISTKDDLSGPDYRTTQIYDISDIMAATSVPDFAGPRMNLNMSTGGQNGNSGGSSSGTGVFGGTGGGTTGQNATLTNRGEVFNTIRKALASVDKDSWSAPDGTGTTGTMTEMGNQLIITQTADNHRQIRELLENLRESKALQITIECRFLQVNTGFLNTIGLDLQTFLNIGSSLQRTAGGFGVFPASATPGTPTATTVTPGVSGGRILPNVTPIAIAQQGMNWSTGSGGGGLTSPITGGIGSIGASASIPAIQVAGTFLDDIQVDFLIQATQANSMSRSLTAPRITIFNGQQAYVTFASQQAYVSNVTPSLAENTVAYTATVSYIPTGTVLQVQGTVSADRRYVMMTVQPQISTNLGFTTYFSIVTGTGGDPNNPVATTGQGQIQLPNVLVQDLSTTVSVPDGGTLLLGGQKASGELEREEGAPILSKIPILRRLFTNEGKVRDEQTVLILIKPKIIIQREEEERFFPGLTSPGS